MPRGAVLTHPNAAHAQLVTILHQMVQAVLLFVQLQILMGSAKAVQGAIRSTVDSAFL